MNHTGRMASFLVVAICASVALVHGCQNSGGKVLGPSGYEPGGALDGGYTVVTTKTCEIPCETVDDCRKYKPLKDPEGTRYELPYAWQSCDEGVCLDVQCMTDADCKGPAISIDPARVDVPCFRNQCAPYPVNGACEDSRDKLVEGRCLRQPEIPDPGCLRKSGDRCECYDDNDCVELGQPWTSCRGANLCIPYQYVFYSNASGRPCDSDAQCGSLYFEQKMLAGGMNTLLLQFWGACSQLCYTVPTTNPSFKCGTGFSCVEVTGLLDPNAYSRTACLPDECTTGAGCEPSFKECIDDGGCDSGQTCVTIWGGCAGVCIDLACSSCAAWAAKHTTHVCHEKETKVWLDGGTAEGVDIPISVRRPD